MKLKYPSDLTGLKFGRLDVLYCLGIIQKTGSIWFCHCSCGKELAISRNSLISDKTTSCGCFHRESVGNMFRTHGLSKTREYRIWSGIKSRCYNKNANSYYDYGGRGIKMCDRWLNSFENFIADNGPLPSLTHSIDRIDVNGNYEPGNVRWATPKEQANNKREYCSHCEHCKTINPRDTITEEEKSGE